jgi:hypothetical protein
MDTKLRTCVLNSVRASFEKMKQKVVLMTLELACTNNSRTCILIILVIEPEQMHTCRMDPLTSAHFPNVAAS